MTDRYIVDLAGTKKTTFKVGSVYALLTSRNINTAAGELTGGGDLSADRTLGLADTTVVPTTYGSASVIPEITVDAKGRLTAVINRTITPGGIGASALGHTHVPADITGFYAYGITGVKSITGGGDLSANRTMELSGDLASPGNTQYYGTNGSGTKGWFSLLGQNLVGLETTGITGLLTLTKSGTTPRTLTAPDASGTIRLVEDLYACIAMNTTIGAPAYGEGKLFWDTGDHTLSLMTEVNGVTLQIGQEEIVRVRNQTGSTITNGQVVHVNGASGSRPTIALALATSVLSDKVIGICTYDIAHNAVGYVTRGGLVRDMDTFAWAEGTELYVSDSVSGGLTSTPPVAPNHAVRVGIVLYSHAVNGIVMVHVDTGNSLNDLHDVYLAAPADKNALRYVTANNRWENTNQGAWLDTAQSFSALQTMSAGAIVSDLTSTYMVVAGTSGRLTNSAIIQGSITGAMTINKSGVTARTYTFPDAAITVAGSASALTSGRVPYVTTGGLLTDSDRILWDNTNRALGIGDGTGDAVLRLNSAAANTSLLGLRTAGVDRWYIRKLATSGDLDFAARNDAGGAIDSPLNIVRAAGGAITLARPVTCSSTLSCTSITASTLTSGRISYSSTGGLQVDSSGLLYGTAVAGPGSAGFGLTIGSSVATDAYAIINGNAARTRALAFQSAGVLRWGIVANNSVEAGANAGTSLEFRAYTDAGAYIDTPINVVRAAAGLVSIARPLTVTGALSATSLTATGLTPGRVPFVTTGGLLTDDASLSYANPTLTVGTNANTNANIILNAAGAGATHALRFQVAGVDRWRVDKDTEAGTDTFRIRAFDNAGTAIDSTISIVRAAGGAITLARPVTCTGVVTVPNGTAAAPGIRTTTYAHGLYSVDATNIGMSAAGVLSLKVTKPNGSTIGSVLTLQSPSAGEIAYFLNSADNSAFILAGGQSSTMGQVRLYGASHATKAGYVEFTRGATVSAYFDGSGNLTCSGTVTVPNGTAGAPGIRLTSEASGLYRPFSTGVGIASAGVAAVAFAATAAGTSYSYMLMYSADATLPTWIANQTTADWMVIGGSAAGMANGGQMRIYGATHATKANYVEFTRGATVSAYFNATGIFTLSTTTDATALGTAAIVSLGGLSVAKNIVAGQALNLGLITATQISSTAGRIVLSSSSTDAMTKATYIVNAHYTNAEESFGTILASSNAATNLLMLGGGSASYNAATSVAIYTGATSATVTGTDRFNVDSTGIIVISNTTNATTVSDGSVRFAGGISVAASKDIIGGGLFKSISGSNYLQFGASATTIAASNGTQTAAFGMAATTNGIATGSAAGDIVLSAPTASARILISAGRLVLLDTTDATTVTDGSVVIPGGISCAKAFVSTASTAGAHYWGPAGTDGSVRVYGNGSGALIVEKRVSGSWVEAGRFA